MRTDKCKKSKKTECEKFQVTLSKSAGMHEALVTAHAAPRLGVTHVKPKEMELRSFSIKFHRGTEYETKLMPKRKTPHEKKKASYFQASILTFSKPNQLSVIPVSSESAFAHSLK